MRYDQWAPMSRDLERSLDSTRLRGRKALPLPALFELAGQAGEVALPRAGTVPGAVLGRL